MSYIEQYRALHSADIYGATSQKGEKAAFIVPHVQIVKPRSVIDYGCGQSTLDRALMDAGAETVRRYDPAIPAYAERPDGQFDLLVSVDVLEHVPQGHLDEVLSDMRALARHALS